MRAIAGDGTREDRWRAWPAMAGWPRLDPTGCSRAVVVAPHPDDEVLGVGGLLAMLAARGVPVTVVAVTDGEASHPDSPTVTPHELAAIRRAETGAALAALGVPADVVRAGLPDGGVGAGEAALTGLLGRLLRPGDWCLATWAGDGHPDHEATGRAAEAACRRSGARLLGYPVWTWHWAEPGDAAVPWHLARRVDLPPEALARKRAAIARFRSQIEPIGPAPGDAPILPPGVLARFDRDHEVVFG